jgi:predicted metalloprotease
MTNEKHTHRGKVLGLAALLAFLVLTLAAFGIGAGFLGETASGQNAAVTQEQTAAAEEKNFAEQTTAQAQGEKVERTTIEAGQLEKFLEDLAYQDLNNFWAQNFAYFAQTTTSAAEDQYSSTYYTPAGLVVVSDEPVETPCGTATPEEAMFYCQADNTIYYGLIGELEMVKKFGDFDFAVALAHEWGHHIQNQLGFYNHINESNDVAFENQADCFAGVWAASNQTYDLSKASIRLALEAQVYLGDVRTEEQGKDHGSPDERVEWFVTGLETGDPAQCLTFAG